MKNTHMKRTTSTTTNNNKIHLGELPIDTVKLQDILDNNQIKTIEANVYGQRKEKEEKRLFRHFRALGIKLKMKESKERRQVIVKLKNHMKFVIFQINPEDNCISSPGDQ
ncbi:hypothetical protein NEOKW01_0683 [Nematocida sp. AWRm80]|nr:hypothetical protein NEOKW01_0683 [Nematocida sp. AWRm80]